MLSRLSKLREKRANGDNGFTLIELLVVVVILGILIAIAIPLYLNYRKGANDKAAQSDLRNAINVLEQCNTDNQAYPASLVGTGPYTFPTATAPAVQCTSTINTSTGTTMNYAVKGDSSAYILSATNSNGAPKIYCYSSAAGGSVATGATVVSGTYRAAC